MKLFIKISNQGEIDLNAFKLIGASTKRDNTSKIGYFGSGLKYSIAVLLRKNIKFKIYSGLTEIKIGTVEETFRDKNFKVISINGEKTNMTVDMGIDWKDWFAVREIYCNAIDEGGFKFELVPSCKAKVGETNFFIELNEETKEILTNWNDYFSNKRKDIIHQGENNKFLYGNSKKSIIYRKGVQCFFQETKSIFHYDLDWIKINESRTVESMWDVNNLLPKFFAKNATVEMIETLFSEYPATFEESLYWDYVYDFSENWITAINGRKLVIQEFAGYFMEDIGNSLILPSKIVKPLKDFFKNRITIVGNSVDDGILQFEPDEKQQSIINEGIEFLKLGGINITLPVKIACFQNENIMGQMKRETILLSKKAFTYGRRFVATVILEEMSHHSSGFGDKTRDFQSYLFNTIISILEEKNNKYL